jgi:heterodisulfide reductase subunit A
MESNENIHPDKDTAGNKERQLEQEQVRIGVFVCDCGTNIAGVIDVASVVEYAKELENVVIAEEGKWICSVDYLNEIKKYIEEHALNRVVVACCTPRTHEPTFKATVKEAGLNPFLLEFVSIREQSSWVHKTDPSAATEKAKELVHMGVVKAALLEPGKELRVPVGKDCMVIGGGLAGMTSAESLAELGFNVLLVERKTALGGLLNSLSTIAPSDESADEILSSKLEQIEQNKNITVFLNTEVTGISGYVGNFKVTLDRGPSSTEGTPDKPIESVTEEREVSTIIVATGMQELEPVGQFGYGQLSNVMTLLQFEELIKNAPDKLADVNDIAFINCVNSRNSERGCCNVGCIATIKNIKTIKEINKNINTYLFYRDFNITGCDVQYHYEAMDKYSAAFRYKLDSPPAVQPDNATNKTEEKLTVQTYDILSGFDVKISADLVVLTTGYIGDPSADRLKGLLKVSANADGFFSEAHVKLRPLDFANEGIYICGCARSPMDVKETLEESLGAAMRAAIPMKKGYVETEGVIAYVDSDNCISCGLCTEACAFSAIEQKEQSFEVISAICKGCGTCAAGCPTEAISIVHYSDEQILSQVDAALADNPENKIIAFACHWCALGAIDNAGVSRLEYPPNIRVIRVMCAGRVDPRFILHAFRGGATGVLVAGCEIPTCHYISGNYYARDKTMVTKRLLDLAGINPNRFRLEELSAAMGPRFAQLVKDLNNELETYGPLANDGYSEQNIQAAYSCTTGHRLRIISSKITEFLENGNKYGEEFTKHEIERLVNDIVYDEFIIQRIKNSLADVNKSVETLSADLGTPTPKILKCMHELRQRNLIKIADIDKYGTIFTSSTPEPEDDETDTKAFPDNNFGNLEMVTNFDLVVYGTAMEGIRKAIEVAESGKKVCVISPFTSCISGPSLITNEFKSFLEFDKEYSELISQLYKNENIRVLRNTEIQKSEDVNKNEINNSSNVLNLYKSASFINEDKCDNCGKCFEVCPVKVIDYDNFGLTNKTSIYQPHPLNAGLKYSIAKGIPYCEAACAVGMDARGYIGKIVDNELTGAAEVMRRTNPLPDICGKICDHACESTCARGFNDEPLEIRKLKKFAIEAKYVVDNSEGRQKIHRPDTVKNHDRSNKIAVVGSGPAGLAAAHDLAILGYPVTIFEALPEAGGMLKVGIPDFRLPPEALKTEVDAILNLGVELKLNTPIGPDLTIKDLKDHGYKAIFIAVGAHKSLRLGVEGEELNGVVNGVELLREFNLQASTKLPENMKIGKKVVVIGGGNVAIDCARTVKRLGADDVIIIYRRTKAEMPAADEELKQCTAEGIEIQYLVTPQKIIGENGTVKQIECIRNNLGLPDASGRRRPVPIEKSEFIIDADSIISAIGQVPDLSFMGNPDDFNLTTRSTFMVDSSSGATNINGVFAGGDAVTGPKNVIGAINGGKLAARGIDEYLSGNSENNPNINERPGERRTEHMELLRLRKNLLLPNLEQYPATPRQPERVLEAVSRITNFAEMELPMTEEDAISEAKRCLSCRMCIGCGVCQMVCPKNAVDYNMKDEQLTINVKEIIDSSPLVETGFQNELLADIYRNSLNAISPMELEFMLSNKKTFNNQVLRLSDGTVPNSIGFIYVPDTEFRTESQTKLDNLEFEYILRMIKHLQTQNPELDLKLFTNHIPKPEFPNSFEHLENNHTNPDELKNLIEIVPENSLKINKINENDSFELEYNGNKYSSDLLIIGTKLGTPN